MKKFRAKYFINLVLISTAIGIAVRLFLIEDFRIASNSMQPSLLPGDLVFASKSHLWLMCLSVTILPCIATVVLGKDYHYLWYPTFLMVNRSDYAVYEGLASVLCVKVVC